MDQHDAAHQPPTGHNTAIVVAVIGVVGVVLAALITGYMQRPPAAPAKAPVAQGAGARYSTVAPAPSPIQLTAALVGKADALGPVHTKTTQFTVNDPIAITLRLNAAPSVANFPVRIDAKLFGGLNMYQARNSADISRPGAQQLTLRFPPRESRTDPLFLLVEIEGEKVYNQEISINEPTTSH